MAEVQTQRSETTLVITINRPQTRNAINHSVAEGMAAACDELDADPDLRVGIITGAGGYFSAGMDIKAFAEGGKSPRIAGRGFAGLSERPPDKPLIAAIEGFALAGGLEVALVCDVIVAADDARLGLPEVKRGLVAGAGGLIRLPKMLPKNVAMEMILTGEPIGADRAFQLGLVNRLCEPGAALPMALEIAATIGANAPLALGVAKRVSREAPGWPEKEVWDRQRKFVNKVVTSDEAREGAAAFAEKRPPRW